MAYQFSLVKLIVILLQFGIACINIHVLAIRPAFSFSRATSLFFLLTSFQAEPFPPQLSERLVQALQGLIEFLFKDDTLYVLLNMVLLQAKHHSHIRKLVKSPRNDNTRKSGKKNVNIYSKTSLVLRYKPSLKTFTSLASI